MTEKIRILVVEDEALVAEDLKDMVLGFGHEVPGIANTGEKAIALAEEHQPDLVLMDINLASEMDGITAGGEIRSRWGIPIIYVTAFANQEFIDRAKKTTPSGYILKPFNERQIQTAIEIALYNSMLEKQLKAAHDQLVAERNRLAALTAALDSMDDPVIITDSMGIIAYVNGTFITRFGYNLTEVEGKHISTLASPENQFAIHMDGFMQDQKSVRTGKFIARSKFGLDMPFLLKGSPVFEEKHLISRVFVLREEMYGKK